MLKFNGLPVYSATLASDTDGVLRVSLVDVPAVESNFDVFRKADPAANAPALYSVTDEDRHLVRGVVLRADYPIFRRDAADDPGYYVVFSREQIRAFAEQYLAASRQNAVDTAHDGHEVAGVQMVQYFLKDTAAGVAPEGFDDIADGSLFAEYHVTNEDVWAEIKAGTYHGFSVEIFYTLIPAESMHRSSAAAREGLLDRIFSKIQDMKLTKEEFFNALARIFGEPKQEPAKFGSVTTDKGVVVWDGDEDLKAGDRVQIEDADGNRSDAADGDYTTGDGKVIVVVDGVVSEIRDPEAEVATQEPQSSEELRRARFARIRAAFDESYEDKERAIIDAIYAARESDEPWYLYEAGDDYAIIALWDEQTYKEHYVRYDIAWNEDGTAVASNPKDVELEFVPADEPAAEDDTEAQMRAALASAKALADENATLRAEVARLRKEPAARPAHESFKGNVPEVTDARKGGSKGKARLDELMNA